jgi:glucokinase
MKLLGIDLGGTNVRVGIVENNSITKILSSPINSEGSEGEVISDIENLITKLITDDVEGIGIGVPSVVDVKEGIVYDVYNIPSWKAVPLKKIFEEKFKSPVVVNNDANCFALGEKYFGKAKEIDNVIGIIIGTGLGAGIITDGKLYSGTNCGAGEFGMIPYKDDILEHYCCGTFFKKYHNISGEELSILAEKKDARALEIFDAFSGHLAYAIKIILYSLDPEMIVLGGSVSKSFRFYKDSLWNNIQDFGYPQSLKKLKIEATELDNIAILGAAALIMDKH